MEAILAPCKVEYVPAGQALQFVCPSLEEYLPAPHVWQTVAVLAPWTAEYVPAWHVWQTVAVLAPWTAE